MVTRGMGGQLLEVPVGSRPCYYSFYSASWAVGGGGGRKTKYQNFNSTLFDPLSLVVLVEYIYSSFAKSIIMSMFTDYN